MSMPKRRESSGHMIGGLFTFALFGLFVLLSLLIVVIGVDGYRGVVNTAESMGQVRTSLGYVVGKVRSDAASSELTLENREGIDTLVLTEIYHGDVLETIIFFRNGALYELAQMGGMDFQPDNAWRLTDIMDFEMTLMEDGMIKLTATASDGRSQSVHVARHHVARNMGEGVVAP